MPIRAENVARYPKDWPQISQAIRERAKWCCEECGVRNGALGGRGPRGSWHPAQPLGCDGKMPEPGEWAWCDGGQTLRIVRIVLTVAHLGRPAQLPFFFHVTRHALAHEVVELIGFLVPLDAETLKWRTMMHGRATTEFLRGPPASGAGFLVALPCGSSCLSPGRSIIPGSAAAPIWIQLAAWRGLGKPFETTGVATEPTVLSNVISADLVLAAASFAGLYGETSLRSAHVFSATGVRASEAAVRRLLRCNCEDCAAYDARTLKVASSFCATDARPFGTSAYSSRMLTSASSGACLFRTTGVVAELDAANGARHFEGGFSRSGHAELYHIDDYPENCSPDNLRSWCQRCHNRYDAAERRAGVRERTRLAMATPDLLAETTNG